MNARWKCPRCGDGCIAPSRPRKNDARRYCLACSAKTGRLVERVCPTHEKRAESERAAKKQKIAKRQEREAEREGRLAREAAALRASGLPAPWPVREAHLRACFQKWARLKAWETDLSRVELVIRRRSRHPIAWTSGHYSGKRIVITVGTDEAYAMETLLHEMAHAASKIKRWEWLRHHIPGRSRDPYYYHGIGFCGFLLSAAREALGVPIEVRGTTVRAVDAAVVEAIRAAAESKA